MSDTSRRRSCRLASALLVALAAIALAPAAQAAEISAFVSGAKPGENWGRGYGGMLTITLFSLVHGEIEGAWQGSDLPDTKMLSASAKAYVGPSIGRLVPYAGLGTGLYRESLPAGSDSGTFGSAFVGVKLKFPIGLVVRGEYQWVHLPDGVLLKLDNRYFVGAGLSF